MEIAVDASTEGFSREPGTGWLSFFMINRAVFDLVSLQIELKIKRIFSVQLKADLRCVAYFWAGFLSTSMALV